MSGLLLGLRFGITLISLVLLAATGYTVMNVQLDPSTEKLAYAFLTGMVAITQSSIGWWFSSSLSSAVNAHTVAQQGRMLASSTLTSPVVQEDLR